MGKLTYLLVTDGTNHGFRIDSIDPDETVFNSGLIYSTEAEAAEAANDYITENEDD